MKRHIPLFLILPLLMSCGAGTPVSKEYADTVIVNARIWTGELAPTWAEALAIREDSIQALGDTAMISELIGPDTEVIDAPAGLVVPGFIDSHVHMMPSGFELSSVQLRDAKNPGEFTQRLADFASTLQEGEWILGGTWDHQNWGGELPHRNWIDTVTPATPVLVTRLDGHMALANSLALELAGVDANTPDVEGGEIVRDANGEPTGILKDNAMELVTGVVPAPSPAQEDQALAQAMDYLAERGVTTVHDMAYNWDSMAVYRRAHTQNRLRTRIYAIVPLASWQRLEAEVKTHGRGDDWLHIGALKGFMDGSLGSHTAAFFEPFTDTPDDRGFFINSPDDIKTWATAADASGLQLVIHAIGDRANAALLDIYEDIRESNGERDRRARIEHAQHLRSEDIRRIKKTGTIPSMQPYHAIDDGRWAESVIGPERAKTTYAFRSLFGAGIPVAFGSDWSVAPASPILGIHAAVTRATLDGEHPGGWVPEQKISAEEALVAYTRNGAHASFEEFRKGGLGAGKLADLVILDQDITTIDDAAIRDTVVVRTIVGGKTVYQRPETNDQAPE